MLVKQLAKDSTLSTSEEEVTSDESEWEEEPQNANATSDCPSDKSSKGDDDDDDDDDEGADPEWKLLEEEAENEECGDDEEKKNPPVSRNGVR